MKKNISIFLIFTFFATTSLTVYAQSSNCRRVTSLNSVRWTIRPAGSTFSNGQIIANTSAYHSFSFPITQNSSLLQGGSPTAAAGAYDTIPMPLTPGVGVRIKWSRYNTLSNIESETLPSGFILTKNGWQTLFKSPGKGDTYSVSFFYTYEIVVIDSDLYKGGKLIIDNTTPVTSIVSGGTPAEMCANGETDLLAAITNELKIPDLPKPASPTCASAILQQSIKMPAIDKNQIAAHGSTKESGSVGETRLRLVGEKCQKGTVIKAYFTDNSDASAQKTYLKSSNPLVGFRMYYQDDHDPVVFGPAPIGSSMPAHDPVTSTEIPSSTSDVLMPFSAQYVRLPSTTKESIQSGPLKASATVTFVYD